MRTLVVTNMYPTPAKPHGGAFVAAQVESLRDIGVEVEVCHLDRQTMLRRPDASGSAQEKPRHLATSFSPLL